MRKILLVIAIIFALAGCSNQEPSIPVRANIGATAQPESTYNFSVTLEWDASVGAISEVEARKEIEKQFKDIYGFKLADDLIILESVIE